MHIDILMLSKYLYISPDNALIMKRKVVKLGPATLVISLPSKWTKKNNVGAGEELDVEEQGSELLIQTEKALKKEKAIIDLTKLKALFRKITASYYLKGYDEIDVKIDSIQKSRDIEKRVDLMIGMEVIEQKKDMLKLKDMGKAEEENIDSVIKRILHLLHSISGEVLKAVEKGEHDLTYLSDSEKHVNRFSDYALRLLYSRGYVDQKKTAPLYTVVFLLELLGDTYKHFVNHITENKLTLRKELILLYKEIDDYHKEFYNHFMNHSYEGAISLAKRRDEIIAKINDMKNRSKDTKEVEILNYFEKITEYIINIMGLLLVVN